MFTKKQWAVAFTQNDKSSNSFRAVYDTEEEFQMWANLHLKGGFTVAVEVQEVTTKVLERGFFPDIKSVDPTESEPTI